MHSSGTARIGNYRLGYQHIVNPCNATALACGDLAISALSLAGENDIYTLTATGGESAMVRLTTTNAGVFSPRFDLYDPAGRLLNTASGAIFTGVLTNAGVPEIAI